jgi:hypothetical protein
MMRRDNRRNRKLALRRDTLRKLTDLGQAQLQLVAGGDNDGQGLATTALCTTGSDTTMSGGNATATC